MSRDIGVNNRALMFYLLMMVAFLGVFGRIVYLQFFVGEELREQCRLERYKYFSIEPIRGQVCAKNGMVMAESVPMFDIYMDVGCGNIGDWRFNNKVDSLAGCLSRLFKDKSLWGYKNLLVKKRKAKKHYVLLQRNINYLELLKVKDFPILRRGQYKGGLIVEKHFELLYPYDQLAKRTIGYQYRNKKGDTVFCGLQDAYADILCGQQGRVLKKLVSGSRWIPAPYGDNIEPKQGYSVQTTIDISVQDVAENALRKCLQQYSAEAGCVVLMEVETGDIVAIANLGKDIKGRYTEIRNYAVGAKIEPGSVFKLPSLMIAIEDGHVTLADSVFVGDGKTKVSRYTIRDAHTPKKEYYTIQEVFEQSSNVGTIETIRSFYGDNPQRFVDGLYAMGLNKRVGIEISGEPLPEIKSMDDKFWSETSMPYMSMGHELKITPLQMLTFYNAVANHGVMMKPRLVTAVLDQDGDMIKTFSPQVLNEAIASSSTIQQAQQMMLGVSERGTARIAFKGAPYTVAGKTGTAQIAVKKNGKKHTYNHEDYIATFAGYFPADNPKYTCVVSIIRPLGKIYGSSVAAPVFREVSDKVFANDTELLKRYRVQDVELEYYSPCVWSGKREEIEIVYKSIDKRLYATQSDFEWVTCKVTDTGVLLKERNFLENTVPDVRGMSAKDAVSLMTAFGFSVVTEGFGFVKRQSVAGGLVVTNPKKIVLKLGQR